MLPVLVKKEIASGSMVVLSIVVEYENNIRGS